MFIRKSAKHRVSANQTHTTIEMVSTGAKVRIRHRDVPDFVRRLLAAKEQLDKQRAAGNVHFLGRASSDSGV